MNLAPNGKPSNLTPEQYKIVRTPEFKAWFGDWENDPANASKVVDENGEPLVVYHGSPIGKRFNTFKGNLFFFASEKNVAKYQYSSSSSDGLFQVDSKVFEVFLNIRKPYVIDVENKMYDEINHDFDDENYDILEQLAHAVKSYWEDDDENNAIHIYDGFIAKRVDEEQMFGAYGKTAITDVYTSFHPNQIKLADGTNTTFDADNPDIRFKRGGVLDGLTEEQVTYIDVISNYDGKGELAEKYKKILKEKTGIDYDEFYGKIDNDLIENADVNNIKTKDDFLNFDNWIKYSHKILKNRGFDENQPQHIEGKLTFNDIKEFCENLNISFEIIPENLGVGNYASHSMGHIKIPIGVDINTFIHEIGHYYDWKTQYDGIAKNPAYATSYYRLRDSNEVYAENFMHYFIANEWLKNNMPMVYKELDRTISSEYKKNIFKLINSLNNYKKGGRTIAQTPAPKKERIKGSDNNPKGSASDKEKAKEIKFSPEVSISIRNKVDKHNKKHPKKKIDFNSAKAVVRRGMGAYSSSHRPTISGGKPNSRVAWGLARLDAFIYKIVNGKSKSGKYSQDDDLIKSLGYKVSKFQLGGEVEYIYFRAYKGDNDNPMEESFVAVEKNTLNEINATNYFLENKFVIEKISKEEYEKYDQGDEFDLFKNGGGVKSNNIFKTFDYSDLIRQKVPSFEHTLNELKEISKIKGDVDFVKRADDIPNYFKTFIIENKIPVSKSDESEIFQLVNDFTPIIVFLKEHFKRLRPYAFAERNDIKIDFEPLDTWNTYSFPSAHAVQSRFIALYLGDKFPKNKLDFIKLADEIADSRLNARVHFPSDVNFGKFVADKLFDFYKKQKEMDLEFIQSRLCYYDKRNPDCTADDDEIEYYKSKISQGKDCSCDNCFYGRTELAEEILRLNSKENEYFNSGGQIYGTSYSEEGFDLMKKHLEEILNKYGFKYFVKNPKAKQVEYIVEGIDIHTSITIYRNYDNNFGRFYLYVYSEKLNPKTQTRTIKEKGTLDNFLKQIAEISKVMTPEQNALKNQIDDLKDKLENILYMYGDSDSEMEQAMNTIMYKDLELKIERLESEYNKIFYGGGQTDAQREKVSHVMREFKEGKLTSHGRVVADDKQAIAIALSEAGIEKKEEGGVIEGQLHEECDSPSGCGEKFDVGGTGHIIEAERGEAVIVSNAFKDSVVYTIEGTPSQIASALNVMGGGKNFDGGAKIKFENGKTLDTNNIKKETNDIDVKDDIESGSVIINRRSMFDKNVYEVIGTPRQIASAINSIDGNGKVIEQGAKIKKI